jgi:tetratricopeptide (TPR) repeat protein
MSGFLDMWRARIRALADGLVEDSADSAALTLIIAFSIPMGFILFIGSVVLKGRILIGLGFFIGTPIFGVAAFMAVKSVSSLMGGFYHSGSTQPNHPAIIKGMYGLAAGYVQGGEFGKARDKYMEILETYPEELDARYLLANLMDQRFGLYAEAYLEFTVLRRIIRERKVDYPYKAAMEERIAALFQALEEERGGKRQRGGGDAER